MHKIYTQNQKHNPHIQSLPSAENLNCIHFWRNHNSTFAYSYLIDVEHMCRNIEKLMSDNVE